MGEGCRNKKEKCAIYEYEQTVQARVLILAFYWLILCKAHTSSRSSSAVRLPTTFSMRLCGRSSCRTRGKWSTGQLFSSKTRPMYGMFPAAMYCKVTMKFQHFVAVILKSRIFYKISVLTETQCGNQRVLMSTDKCCFNGAWNFGNGRRLEIASWDPLDYKLCYASTTV